MISPPNQKGNHPHRRRNGSSPAAIRLHEGRFTSEAEKGPRISISYFGTLEEKIQAGAAGTGMGNARADDGHSATDLGVKVETLSRSGGDSP